jgi:hypothetical protein
MRRANVNSVILITILRPVRQYQKTVAPVTLQQSTGGLGTVKPQVKAAQRVGTSLL